jgi:actin-like ATPase involved in cell morphogenesis
MSYSLGIDLGTTYTAAAVVRGGRAEVATLGYRATSIPTVVVLTEDGTVVVGDAAERRGASAPDRLAREFKRRVGDPTPILLGGSPVSVDRLLAEVLRVVCRAVGETEGGPPASTVVTHPANWGPFKRDVLVQALRLAGLDNATLLPEPVAAATWYARAERPTPGSVVAVYDLGGGTFDAAVLEMGTGSGFSLRGRPEGVERLGGVDVDAAVINHVLRDVGPDAARLDPDDPGTKVAMARLRGDCVEAKEALSTETSVTIPVTLPGITDDVLLRRSELEELVAPVLAPTIDALRRAVASAELRAGQPDAVLLVGGASRMPLVAREVSVALGRPVAIDAHPKHPVALGAALVAEQRRPSSGAGGATPVAAPPGGPANGSRGPLPAPPVGPPPGRAGAAVTASSAGVTAAAGPTTAGGPGSAGPGLGGPGAGPAIGLGPAGLARGATSTAAGPYGPPGGATPLGRAQWSGPPLRDPTTSAAGPPVRGPRLTEKMRPAGWFAWIVTILVLGIAGLVTYLQISAADDQGGGLDAVGGSGDGAEEASGGGDPGEGGGGTGADLLWDADVSEATYGVPATDGTLAFVPDETGRVTAFDVATGDQAWQVKVGDVGGSLALLVGGHLLVTTSEPTALLALDPTTGATVWTAPDVYVSSPPAVVGDLLVLSAGFDVQAVNVTNGAVAWQNDYGLEYLFDGQMVASPAGDVVVGAEGSENTLIGLSPTTGEILWRTELPRRTAMFNEMVAVGDAVASADDDGYVTVVGFADGAVRQSWDIGAGTFPSPVPLGTDLAVYLDSNELYMMDPASGEELARMTGASTTFTVLPGDTPGLLVAAYDSLIAVDAGGQELWRSPMPFPPFEVAAAGDVAVVADSEGRIAVYRLPA